MVKVQALNLTIYEMGSSVLLLESAWCIVVSHVFARNLGLDLGARTAGRDATSAFKQPPWSLKLKRAVLGNWRPLLSRYKPIQPL